MATPTPSWNTVRVHAIWINYDGTRKAGTYRVDMPVRVTNSTDDVIIPKGLFAAGSLATSNTAPSFDLQIPASDDPDNLPSSFQPILTITFADGTPAETYYLTLPVALSGNANGINLRTIVLAEVQAATKDVLIRGVAGGVAALDANGKVLDGAGNIITSGGSTDISGLMVKANNLSDLTNATTARTNLGLGNSATKDTGTTASTVAAGNDSRITGAATATALTAETTRATTAEGTKVAQDGTITKIVSLSQSAYNALGTPVSTTLYVIV